jgi:Transposase DDE domain
VIQAVCQLGSRIDWLVLGSWAEQKVASSLDLWTSSFAVQAEPRPPRSHPAGASSGDELAGLRQRASLTVWFTDEVVAAWAAERHATRGGQSRSSLLAIMTVLTLRTVFRLAYRQPKRLIASIVGLPSVPVRTPVQASARSRWPRPSSAADPLRVVGGAAFQAAIAVQVNRTAELPRCRRAASWAAEFVARWLCFGL